MALSQDQIRAAAERLDRAEKSRTQIRQLSQEFPAITLDDAYAIQKAWIEIKTSAGRVVKGHKIGLTSKAMQSALNIDEPDSGVLLDDMFFADGGIVPTGRFIATRVEAEFAFVMSKRLAGPDCTMFDVLNATELDLMLLRGRIAYGAQWPEVRATFAEWVRAPTELNELRQIGRAHV